MRSLKTANWLWWLTETWYPSQNSKGDAERKGASLQDDFPISHLGRVLCCSLAVYLIIKSEVGEAFDHQDGFFAGQN